jgi:Ca2+-binding RTX toxin-like protein
MLGAIGPSIGGLGSGKFVAAWTETDASATDSSSTHIALIQEQLERTTTSTNAGETVFGDDLIDRMNGGSGIDTFYGMDANDVLSGGGATDFLLGGNGDDILNGQDGADILFWDAGNDTFNGGAGIDYATYAIANSSVNINLVNQTGNSGAAQGDTFNSVEAFFLTAQADIFTGDTANNFVFAQGGADIIVGGGGGDIIYGEGGDDLIQSGVLSDIVVGGSGADSFAYNLNDLQQDQILDFASGIDRFVFDNIEFNVATGTSLQNGVNFISTTSAQGASYGGTGGVFIYYTDLGFLYADADGGGAGAANWIAALGANTQVLASDLVFDAL